jgi:DNA-binding transcriptional ArsR family regulator
VVEQHGSVGSPPDPTILDDVFSALADGTRRDMLRRLTAGERTIGDLAQPYDMSFEAASKHVRVLERAGLVHRSVRGRNHYCQLDASRLAEADRWLSFYQRFWMERFAALDRVLARRGHSPSAGPKPGPAHRTSPRRKR